MKQIAAFLILSCLLAFAPEPKKTIHQHYIEDGYIATVVCRNLHSECGIPASIQAAQAILESHGGMSDLAIATNNHFGIKAYSDWKGETYKCNTGVYRKYKSVEEGYEDHAIFMHDNYINAVGKPYQHWVKYCTGYGGKGYWQRIGYIIKFYNLDSLDK